MTIHIFAAHSSPRLEYVLQFVCGQIFQCDFRLYTISQDYQCAPGPFLNYSRQRILAEEVFIPAGSLLAEEKVHPQRIEVFQDGEWPAFFAMDLPQSDLPFDLFALVFYLLSRYEEYLPFPADEHQRFCADHSLAFQAGFLSLPLIDLWLGKLQTIMATKFPAFSQISRSYTFLPTYDIDMAWAYLHKGLLRMVGAMGRDLFRGNIEALWGRWLVQMGVQKDPFFTFGYMDKLHKRFQLQPLYFFLLANPGTYDKNIAWEKPAFQSLIKQLSQSYRIGIHPSYQSNSEENLLRIEKQRLETISNQTIHRSRQHFLKMTLPQTYRRLRASGLREDYTMGYARQIGFRASTCTPFYWYDLEKEKMTDLKVFPFAVMDVTLKQYLELSPEEALAQVEALIEKVRAVGGTFSTLWHNNSFADMEGWEGWREVYEGIVEAARE